MRIATAVIAGVAALASVGGAVVGYQELAPDAASATTEAATTAEPQDQRRQVRVRFRRCPEEFALERDTCVRRVTQRRTVPVPASGPVVTGSSAGQPVARSEDDTPHFDDHGGDRPEGESDDFDHDFDDSDQSDGDDDRDDVEDAWDDRQDAVEDARDDRQDAQDDDDDDDRDDD
jgi:hypothetical protein